MIDKTFAATRAAMNDAADEVRAKLQAYTLATVSQYHTNNEVFLMIMRDHNQINPQMIAM